ncbi:ribosomal maturation YjgA family protein [Aureliella helgolandensis]|nr:DUF2809 domain-containing protein [Aureliella helgolandensis]
MNSTRLLYFVAAMPVVLAGLASRKYRGHLPPFLAEYAGDTLWALMLYLLISTLLARSPIRIRVSISLALAFSVETSQLYHAPWLDSIRQTTLGGLVLGFGFLWSDLVCYSIGIALGAVTEWGIVRVTGPKLENLSSD